ncbi:MoaD/ThiS family protein [Calidithermus chliarophilus]|uniref:MoaD/ThiS family protein n=1 Tax=Calidithermus chliarophilus TaxID=52023 RepID=UPI0004067978|nr:MoaD/ThiS family protein [Calidithermus chliarophilus]
MKVWFSSHFREYTGGQAEVTLEAPSPTLAALIAALDQRYPGLAFRIVDEQGRLRPHVNLVVDDAFERDLSRGLEGSSRVGVVAALSGG